MGKNGYCIYVLSTANTLHAFRLNTAYRTYHNLQGRYGEIVIWCIRDLEYMVMRILLAEILEQRTHPPSGTQTASCVTVGSCSWHYRKPLFRPLWQVT